MTDRDGEDTSEKEPQLYGKGDRKRVVKLEESQSRSEFRRDFGRLLHSPSFRRLQGKTQLFPGSESDFVRTRLTHSLEVAQIGKSIALRLNREHAAFQNNPIDVDLVEFSCLAHDLGHPPFGHIGEGALDRLMCGHGGFEGNAQTLRILSVIEKKELRRSEVVSANDFSPVVDRQDRRAGLNVTYRSLASILKYDSEIETVRPSGSELQKGYYASEHDLVRKIKEQVLGAELAKTAKLRTVECTIMDTADDIAYSTYDLEDTFKSRLLSPIGFWLKRLDEALIQSIAKKLNRKLKEYYPGEADCTPDHVTEIMYKFFEAWFAPDGAPSTTSEKAVDLAFTALELGKASQEIAESGYYRTSFTSKLVGQALDSIEVIESDKHPALHQVRLKVDKFKEIEVLKGLNFGVVIGSSLLKTIEYRGNIIINRIFEALSIPPGEELLPDDYRILYSSLKDATAKKRVICDFISGMTDRYAMEFYDKLVSSNAGSIYKPHH